MREILFRGKRKDNGEWVEGYLHIKYFQKLPHDRFVIEYETECDYDSKSWRPKYMVAEIDPETVGQYTGLTDKNGKKIFEGDIVKREYTLWHSETKRTRETQIGVVSYSNKECGFFLDKVCNLRKPWDGDTIEIIGNIHDNPELLEV